MMDFLPQNEVREKIVRLRSSCKKDIEKYLKKVSGQNSV
jgi:hypothetical protein